MLYQIDHKTWLDLPPWKCREEFAELFRYKRQPKPDPDRLAELKAACDRIIEEHASGRITQRKPRASVSPRCRRGTPIDMYGLDGHYIKTFASSAEAAAEVNPDGSPITVSIGIMAVARKCEGYAYGYMFRRHVDGSPRDIEPWRETAHNSMPVTVTYADGGEREFESMNDVARMFGLSKCTVHKAVKTGRVIKKRGITIKKTTK